MCALRFAALRALLLPGTLSNRTAATLYLKNSYSYGYKQV